MGNEQEMNDEINLDVSIEKTLIGYELLQK